MGLFAVNEGSLDLKAKNDVELLHRMGCKICPLRGQSTEIPATGASAPLLYFLGEAAGKDEEREGRQFVGKSGQLLRPLIPRDLKDRIRWNNVVRRRPPNNRTPEFEEIEACRPSVIADIQQSKPRAIFGFGNVPLQWVSGFNGIMNWRGRVMPVRVGSHVCWYYAFIHPSFLLRKQGDDAEEDTERQSSDYDLVFKLDLARAFDEVRSGLPKPVVHSPDMACAGVDIVTECNEQCLGQIANFLSCASREEANGIDYETNCLRPYEEGSELLSVAVSFGSRTLAFSLQQRHWGPRYKILEGLWCDYLCKATACKVVHNLSFEMEWTALKFGQDLLRKGLWECTASQAAILDERKGPRKPGCFSLEFLVQQYFGFNIKKLSGVDRADMTSLSLEQLLRYNALDAKYHLLLWQKQKRRLEEEQLEKPYELNRRKVPTLVMAQVRGVPVDRHEVKRLQIKYRQRFKELSEQIAALTVVKSFVAKTGKAFNPQSNPDVLYVFKDMLKRKECEVWDKKTHKQKYSVDEEVLLQIDHPLAELVVRLRKAVKQKSTYIDPLDVADEKSVIFADDMIHATFNTFFVETGRLSAEAPNLQNFPKREDEAKEVRKQIIPAKGKVVLAVDYGQIEARVYAMLTKDKRFCKMLWERYDIHKDWTERLAHAYPSRIGGKKMLTDKKAMKDFRTDIKSAWTFPLIYGASLETASGHLRIPIDKVRPVFNQFWKEFEGIAKWQEEELAFYRENGYVEWFNGRRRRGPLSRNKVFNTPGQTGAAEIVLEAMCRLSETGDPELQPEIQIHDDLTFLRVDPHRFDVVAEKLLNIMLDVRHMPYVNVPISVEMSVGPNWLEMEEVGTFFSDKWFK